MKKQLLFVLGVFLFMASCSGGGGDPTPSTVTVTISPSTEGQSISVAVTAEFSGDITEPADQTAWLSAFKLQKDADGDNLCSAIAYADNVATCTHDDLLYSSSYTVTVSGISDTNGNPVDTTTETFETEEESLLSVNGISKTSVASTGTGNEVEVTFSFDGTPEEAPTVTVNGGTPQACALDGDSCTITLTGVKGCTTLQDYVLILTGTGINDYTYTINSADDEFDNSATLVGGTCYTDRTSVCSASITGGTLRIVQPAADDENCDIYKIFSGNFAATLKTGTFSPGTSADGERMQVFSLMEDGDPYVQVSLLYGYSNQFTPNTQWGWMSGDDDGMEAVGIAKSDTEPYGNTSLYKCIAFVGDKVYSYISEDGETFIHLTTSNTKAVFGTTLPSSLNYPVTWTNVRARIAQANTATTSILTGTFDFIRFKSDDLNGTSADCPTLY